MDTKRIISEREAAKLLLKELHNASEGTIEALKERYLADVNVDFNKAKTIYFFASIYCAMISISDFLDKEQVERIRGYISRSIAEHGDYYVAIEEIHKSFTEWDEPFYDPSPEHLLEGIAKYLYLKWGIPLKKSKLGEQTIERPNLFLVYVIEACLITVMSIGKHLNENYSIVHEN